MAGIDGTIRRLTPSDYSPGFSAPDTLQDQSIPQEDSAFGGIAPLDPGHNQALTAEPQITSPARRGTPNHFGFHAQDGQLMAAYREVVINATIADGGRVLLEPDHATAWEITAEGSLALDLGETLPPYPQPPGFEGLPFLISMCIVVHVVVGATIVWPDNVYWPPNTDANAFVAATSSRTDQYVLVRYPGSGSGASYWLGHVIAQGYVPAASLTAQT